MRIPAKTRTAGAHSALLPLCLCCAVATDAFAQQGLFINEQIQLGDVFSTQVLNVETAEEGVGATTTAVGNIVSAVGQNTPVDFHSGQTVDQTVAAYTEATVADSVGEYLMTVTSATGNSATAGTCCAPTTGVSIQSVNAGAVVTADASSVVDGEAGSVSVDTMAVGNTQGWNQINGHVDTWTAQRNSGLTSATNSAEIAGSPGNVGLSATAVANNVSIDAQNSTTDVGVEQIADGQSIDAVVTLRQDFGADIQGLATATGNLVDMAATSPYAIMNVNQGFDAPLNAYTNLNVGEWSGDVSAVAYGVGNSVVMNNVGARGYLGSNQTSQGEINATAAITGGAGVGLFASATAMGNAVSGYACTDCGGDFEALNRQIGGAQVRAQSNIVANGRARQVGGDATAVGNSATYEIRSRP